MAKSKKIDINQMFMRAHKQAVKTAVQTAARTRTNLVSRKGSKVIIEKPNLKFMGYEPIEPSKKRARPSSKKTRSKK